MVLEAQDKYLDTSRKKYFQEYIYRDLIFYNSYFFPYNKMYLVLTNEGTNLYNFFSFELKYKLRPF